MSEKEVRIGKFILIDENGVGRATLCNRAALSASRQIRDPSLALYDCKDKQHALVEVGTCSDGTTALGFYDLKKWPRSTSHQHRRRAGGCFV